jgi:hypothetical protein
MKCLQKSAADRYQSAMSLSDDLGRFLQHKPIAARPAGVMERMAKWTRRHPSRAGALAASIVEG